MRPGLTSCTVQSSLSALTNLKEEIIFIFSRCKNQSAHFNLLCVMFHLLVLGETIVHFSHCVTKRTRALASHLWNFHSCPTPEVLTSSPVVHFVTRTTTNTQLRYIGQTWQLVVTQVKCYHRFKNIYVSPIIIFGRK
jgi:hypothetical protein